MNPSIFVLDEPTANLDAGAIHTLRQQIIQIKKGGRLLLPNTAIFPDGSD